MFERHGGHVVIPGGLGLQGRLMLRRSWRMLGRSPLKLLVAIFGVAVAILLVWVGQVGRTLPRPVLRGLGCAETPARVEGIVSRALQSLQQWSIVP